MNEGNPVLASSLSIKMEDDLSAEPHIGNASNPSGAYTLDFFVTLL